MEGVKRGQKGERNQNVLHISVRLSKNNFNFIYMYVCIYDLYLALVLFLLGIIAVPLADEFVSKIQGPTFLLEDEL